MLPRQNARAAPTEPPLCSGKAQLHGPRLAPYFGRHCAQPRTSWGAYRCEAGPSFWTGATTAPCDAAACHAAALLALPARLPYSTDLHQPRRRPALRRPARGRAARVTAHSGHRTNRGHINGPKAARATAQLAALPPNGCLSLLLPHHAAGATGLASPCAWRAPQKVRGVQELTHLLCRSLNYRPPRLDAAWALAS
jgi:hypothetical protein